MKLAKACPALIWFLLPCCAYAGAWTQERGKGQTITTITLSQASQSFDAKSNPTQKISYSKQLTQTHIEYGLRDSLTLFIDPEYARAKSARPDEAMEYASAFSFGAGMRIRLWNDKHIISLEGSYKTAGAFNTSVSVDQESGRQFELRALYGYAFPVFGKKTFIDISAGHRFVAGKRPGEFPIDLTLGLHLTSKTMLMAQSFNIIAHGNAHSPYNFYRSHKLQLSLVQHVWRDVTVQISGFVSPMGQNALKEQGLSIAIWQPFSL